MASVEWKRTVPCKDGSRRDREVAVSFNEDGLILLSTPPGEATVLTVQNLALFIQALREIQLEAIHRSRLG